MKREPKSLQALLNSIERGETRNIMRKLLDITNTGLGKKLHDLIGIGLIEEVQKRPYALYRLTPLGYRVNQFLAQSDMGVHKTLTFRCHNLIVGWQIKDWGSWQFNPKLWKDMRNWHFQELVIKGHKIHIQESGLLKIYCPEVYASNADEGFDRAVEEAKKVANYVASKYGMGLENYHRVRNGQKEAIGTEKLGQFIGHMKLGGVWVDISDKQNRRLEADQDNHDLEKLFAMPDEMKELREVLSGLKQHWDIHLPLMQHTDKVLGEIRDAIKELREAVREKK